MKSTSSDLFASVSTYRLPILTGDIGRNRAKGQRHQDGKQHLLTHLNGTAPCPACSFIPIRLSAYTVLAALSLLARHRIDACRAQQVIQRVFVELIVTVKHAVELDGLIAHVDAGRIGGVQHFQQP